MTSKQNKQCMFPFYSFLLGLFPIFILWAYNVAQIKPQSVLISLVVTIVFVALIWFLCLWIFRSVQKASLLSSLLFILFFSFGHVYNAVQGISILGTEIGFIKLTIVYLLLLVGSVILAAKIKKFSPNLTLALNWVFTLLVVYNLGRILFFVVLVSASSAETKVLNTASSQSTTLPDVYYIIFDSYAREDVFKNVLKFDNSDFINALQDRGFYIADCANSNYDGTLQSITSSLNYSYLDSTEPAGDDSTAGDPKTINQFMNNKARKDFAALGYKFVTARGFSSFDDINNSDLYLNFRKDQKTRDNLEQVDFANLYLRTTLIRDLYELYDLNPLKYQVLPYWLYSTGETKSILGHASYWYYQTNYLFDALEKLPKQKENYFVYAHFNAPHGPYVFDQNGIFRYTHEPADPSKYYLDTVIYLNKRILYMVDMIIQNSDVPPIIVLQGDHAPHVITTGYDRHKILEAYYFPNGKSNALYETITPVNTFRVILREYFNQEIPLLPDNIYVKLLLPTHEENPSSCETPK